ncbi:MAG TPA: DUF1993 domain-containing protein [Gammaproteobacteria bacterium]
MPISMYQISVVPLIRALNNLSAVLQKGLEHAEARKIDPAVFSSARLFPDMLPLARQVHIASDIAKACGARLAGIDPPKYEDVEFTFPELQARIAKTIAFLKTLSAKQIDGAETREINFKNSGKSLTMPGLDYLLKFVQPNVHFHVTTAYGILRHNGVEIGKADYQGKLD